MARFALALTLAASAMSAFSAEKRPSLWMQLVGSTHFADGVRIEGASAVLLLDETRVGEKGVATGYLVVSSRPVGCETIGEFNAARFAELGLVPYPKLPSLESPADFSLVAAFVNAFDPRVAGPSLLNATLAASPRNRATSLHLHDVMVTIRTPSAAGRSFDANPPGYNVGVTVLDGGELHFDPRQSEAPFDAAPVVLRRGEDSFLAEIDLHAMNVAVTGNVEARVCPAVLRSK